MAEVTTALIKELRELTGAGILACKNALVETELTLTPTAVNVKVLYRN